MTEQANAVRDREERIQKALEAFEWECAQMAELQKLWKAIFDDIDRVAATCPRRDRYDA